MTFYIRRKYEHIWEWDLEEKDISVQIRTTSLSHLMRLDINIYISLDQDAPQFQINHS